MLRDARQLELVDDRSCDGDVCCRTIPMRALIRHGLSVDRFAELLRQQDGVCGICEAATDLPLLIDHDHICCPGKHSCGRCVRGLLCAGCNGELGAIEASAAVWIARRPWIEAARAYLARTSGDPYTPARWAAVGVAHRRRVAKPQRRDLGGCYHCTGDEATCNGWVVAVMASGGSVWDGVHARAAELREQARASG